MTRTVENVVVAVLATALVAGAAWLAAYHSGWFAVGSVTGAVIGWWARRRRERRHP